MAKTGPSRLRPLTLRLLTAPARAQQKKHRVLGVRGVPVSAPLGVELTYFYFGGVKMKKVGLG